MARTTPRSVGAWPAPIPFGEATAAVWLDGSTASAAIAHWLTQAGARWTALLDESPRRPARARTAARALAASLGVAAAPVSAAGPVTRPTGWAVAADAAQSAGAGWLVLPVRADAAEPPLPLRLHAAEAALAADGLGGLWTPLLGWEAIAVARLALALGVPFEHTWDCEAEAPCGTCQGCGDRRRAFKQLGMPDPAA